MSKKLLQDGERISVKRKSTYKSDRGQCSEPQHQESGGCFPGIALTALRFGPGLAKTGLMAGTLTGPFSKLVDQHVTDPWLRNNIDLECFVLRHVPERANKDRIQND